MSWFGDDDDDEDDGHDDDDDKDDTSCSCQLWGNGKVCSQTDEILSANFKVIPRLV